MDRTETARKFFSADIFATETTDIIIDEAEDNHAKCHFDVTVRHLNANGFVMGGAIFTLADFAFAVAANELGDAPATVTASSQIQYLRPAKCSRLSAETVCLKDGKTSCVMEINITDENGRLIAKAVTNGIRIK